ncbi:TIGR03032 family protein [Amylibacter sp.]|nr:TIGR03032 family protein [Amylibacter sp.]
MAETRTPFTTMQQIYKNSKGRKLVLFGAGPIAEKTFRKLHNFELNCIVDNAENLWGKIELNSEIKDPSILKNRADLFVVICTTSFSEVAEQLRSFNFEEIDDFCVSPLLNDLKIIEDLQSINRKILFSSGSPKQSDPSYGGGLYELKVSGDTWHHTKVFSGNCYGIEKFNGNFISVDQEIGIFEFNENYEILRSKKLPAGLRAHGVRYSNALNRFYVVGSYLDGILVLDNNWQKVDEIPISHKKLRTGVPKHHCNDCLVLEDSLYVSMFSRTGNWQNDSFDGCVIEIDLHTHEIVGDVVNNLWMPHNIEFIDGSFHLLNSLPGQLLTNNFSVVGQFPAFARGLAHDGIYYYVGQSRNRNYSKNMGVSKNISIDAGIIVFDEQTKASRFLQLPPKLSEIHSIQILE